MKIQHKEKSKRQAIREAAARLFRDKGYSATSMRDLARAVELKAPSLYNHIKSKEEILQQICFDNAHRFLHGMQTVETMEATAAQKVRELLRLHIYIATEDFTSVTAFNDEWRHLSEPHLSEFKALRRDYENRFRVIIEAGIRSGEFKALDPNLVLYTLFSSIRWLYDWYRDDKTGRLPQLEREIIQVVMEGVENRGTEEQKK